MGQNNSKDSFSCEDALLMMDEASLADENLCSNTLFKNHIDSCDKCREEYRIYRRMAELIKKSSVDLPNDLHSSIMNSVSDFRTKKMRLDKIRRISKYSTAAAAFLIIIALTVSGVLNSISKTSDSSADMVNNAAPKLFGMTAENSPDAGTQESSGENYEETAALFDSNSTQNGYKVQADTAMAYTNDTSAMKNDDEVIENEIISEENIILETTAPDTMASSDISSEEKELPMIMSAKAAAQETTYTPIMSSFLNLLKDIPPIPVIKADTTEIPFIYYSNTQNEESFTTLDLFSKYSKLNYEVPYINLGEEITITFEGKAPDTFTLTDYILTSQYTQKYDSKTAVECDAAISDNAITFTLNENYAAYLSSLLDDYNPGNTYRGFKLYCKWYENNNIEDCEYVFVVRTDALD